MNNEQKTDNAASAFDWLDAMMSALVIIVLVLIFIAKPYAVNGSSMDPTLESGSRIIVGYVFYSPKQGDIVVVDKNSAYGASLVKRVIATENQTIFIDPDTGELKVDGVTIDIRPENVAGNREYPITVPDGYCFLMGDNRGVSHDSRFTDIGFIKNAEIMGKVLFVFSPFHLAGVPE